VILLLSACSKQQPAPADIQRSVSLAKAASCESLTQTVHDVAVRQMRSQMDSYKQWSYGPPVEATGGAATPAASAPPSSYTTTNTQVAGVDEADFVKNDGTRIFVLAGQTLYAARSWPPQDLALAGKLQIEGWPSTMFLDGNQVVVFSTIWTTSPSAMTTVAPCPSSGCGGYTTTKVTVVDVSTLSAPAAQAELYLPGYSAGARRIGSSIRLVLSDSVRWPDSMQWWPAYDPDLYQHPDKFIAAIDDLENKNEALIRATPLSQWFPAGERKHVVKTDGLKVFILDGSDDAKLLDKLIKGTKFS